MNRLFGKKNQQEPVQTRTFGKDIEHWVEQQLQAQGLKALYQNALSKMGEIDLIMLDGKELVFVEVRYRRTNLYGDGIDSVTKHKRVKLIRAAQYFLLKNPQYADLPCRFDVVGVSPLGENYKMSWIQNAFEVE